MESLYCNAQYINSLYRKITSKTVSKLNKLKKCLMISFISISIHVLTFTYTSDYTDFTSK